MINGEVNERKILRLVERMIEANADKEKIEDILWHLKKHYDEKARYYKEMYSNILFTLDRVDNQEYDPQEFQETSEDHG